MRAALGLAEPGPRGDRRGPGAECRSSGEGRGTELLSILTFIGLFFFFFFWATLILKTHVEELKECSEDQKSPMTTKSN